MGLALAVDIGGTKVAVGLVDRRGGVVAHQEVPTRAMGGPESLWGDVAGLVTSVQAGAPEPVEVVGVGCGGPMRGRGAEVSPVNIPAWRSFPLRSRLEELTGLTTVVDNDAKALALGEAWRGAAQGERNFLAMVVSTGVGGGIVLDGRLLDGADGNAGHIGHLVVEPDGRRCGCGAQGCLEAEASGTALAASTGRPPAEASSELRRRTGRLVGRAVASVAALLDLQVAVVAGSVALGFGTEFFDAAQAELATRARIDHARGAVIRPAGLGASGPLVGAAAVGWRAVGVDVGVR